MIYIIVIVCIIFLIIGIVGFSEPAPHTYNAAFGSSFGQLSMWNHGFAATGAKALTKKASMENCALFGPTGSGKSTVCIISSSVSLARGKSSIIFNDVTGEVYDRTSSYLASKGYKILRLDFSNSRNSESFNPLLECKTISDIQKICLLIVRNALGESKGDIFWEQSSIMLMSLFARYLIFHTEEKYRSLQNVLRLVEKFAVDGETVDRLFVRTNDEELLSAYKATIVVGDKTLQSIIATTRTALSLFCDKEVCRTTARNTIDFNLLRQEPVALYVCNPLKDLQYFKPLSALFFQSLFNYSLSRIPEYHERGIFYLIDESATMRFPNLSTTISTIRKFRSGILLAMQDEFALTAQYGAAEAHQIKTNCGCQIYLKGQPLHTCKELSQILGKHTYVTDKGIEKVKELATPDEIRMLDEAIILINNQAPLKCRTVPYYENIWLSHLGSNKPYVIAQKEIQEPAIITFSNE